MTKRDSNKVVGPLAWRHWGNVTASPPAPKPQIQGGRPKPKANPADGLYSYIRDEAERGLRDGTLTREEYEAMLQVMVVAAPETRDDAQ